MKTISTLIVTAALFFGSACNNSANKVDTEVATAQTNNAAETDEHEHSANDPIELDNGAKWKVVPEMMQHIKNMESDVNSFYETQHSEMKDFTVLGKSLQKNLDLLTSNCTMEGKAHDELHKWLLPYIDLVEGFNKSKDIEDATHRLEEIHTSFKTFNIYFE